nr:CDGSH iron-sulfur domain-containing protein 1-like [Equus asinus]
MGLTSRLPVERISAVTIAAGTAAIAYQAYKRFYVKDHRRKSTVKLHMQKDNPNVYCHCWRSKKFPFSDGFHTKYNKEMRQHGTSDH